MFNLPASVRVVLATGPVDMRKSIDGLMALVPTAWGEDVYSGHLFAFVSRRGDRIKVLTWSRGGFVLLYKRLETGRFRLPPVDAGAQVVHLDATQLAMLLDGIDVAQVRRQPAWTPPGRTGLALRPAIGAQRGAVLRCLDSIPALADDRVDDQNPALFDDRQHELRGAASEEESKAARDEAAKKKRQQRAARKAEEIPAREIRHAVPVEERHCPACGSEDLRPLGRGRTSEVYEYILSRFERQVHVQEVLACARGRGVVTAPPPARGVDRGEYGPGFLAHVVTSKCADAMPLHRLAQRVERSGVPMSRSTLTDLFHQAASVLLPLSHHLLQCIASADVVWAYEAPLRVLDVKKTRLGYLWTFLTQNEAGEWLIGYRFSMGRASKTPKEVLGGTSGALVVDAYTGYNAVALPQGRVRVGCWAHCRRRIFDALATAPEAREALDFILDLYRVEAQARDADLVRTAALRGLRQLHIAPVIAQLHAWLETQAPRHPPKSPLGQAISHFLRPQAVGGPHPLRGE
ncbi:IS66 family transposase [Myxococcus xanthus]|uniref:IS66 family transposase n=1 Tax=Myxococcus xanthus TaxID=34 RepID=UPI001F032724|nr:IS66 family transposase [Myxococcus xanthus]